MNTTCGLSCENERMILEWIRRHGRRVMRRAGETVRWHVWAVACILCAILTSCLDDLMGNAVCE